MRRGFANPVCDHFEGLANVDDERARNHWDIYPVPFLIENLQSFDLGW